MSNLKEQGVLYKYSRVQISWQGQILYSLFVGPSHRLTYSTSKVLPLHLDPASAVHRLAAQTFTERNERSARRKKKGKKGLVGSESDPVTH